MTTAQIPLATNRSAENALIIPGWLRTLHAKNQRDLLSGERNPSEKESRLTNYLMSSILPRSIFSDFTYIVLIEWAVNSKQDSSGKGDLVLSNGRDLLVVEIKVIPKGQNMRRKLSPMLKVIRQARYYALVVCMLFKNQGRFPEAQCNRYFESAKVLATIFTNYDNTIHVLKLKHSDPTAGAAAAEMLSDRLYFLTPGLTIQKIYETTLLNIKQAGLDKSQIWEHAVQSKCHEANTQIKPTEAINQKDVSQNTGEQSSHNEIPIISESVSDLNTIDISDDDPDSGSDSDSDELAEQDESFEEFKETYEQKGNQSNNIQKQCNRQDVNSNGEVIRKQRKLNSDMYTADPFLNDSGLDASKRNDIIFFTNIKIFQPEIMIIDRVSAGFSKETEKKCAKESSGSSSILPVIDEYKHLIPIRQEDKLVKSTSSSRVEDSQFGLEFTRRKVGISLIDNDEEWNSITPTENSPKILKNLKKITSVDLDTSNDNVNSSIDEIPLSIQSPLSQIQEKQEKNVMDILNDLKLDGYPCNNVQLKTTSPEISCEERVKYNNEDIAIKQSIMKMGEHQQSQQLKQPLPNTENKGESCLSVTETNQLATPFHPIQRVLNENEQLIGKKIRIVRAAAAAPSEQQGKSVSQ